VTELLLNPFGKLTTARPECDPLLFGAPVGVAAHDDVAVVVPRLQLIDQLI
jgi:hypothetical protein